MLRDKIIPKKQSNMRKVHITDKRLELNPYYVSFEDSIHLLLIYLDANHDRHTRVIELYWEQGPAEVLHHPVTTYNLCIKSDYVRERFIEKLSRMLDHPIATVEQMHLIMHYGTKRDDLAPGPFAWRTTNRKSGPSENGELGPGALIASPAASNTTDFELMHALGITPNQIRQDDDHPYLDPNTFSCESTIRALYPPALCRHLMQCGIDFTNKSYSMVNLYDMRAGDALLMHYLAQYIARRGAQPYCLDRQGLPLLESPISPDMNHILACQLHPMLEKLIERVSKHTIDLPAIETLFLNIKK
jgi:hypothetical protein